MYRNHWVTSDVQFRKGASIPPFGWGLAGLILVFPNHQLLQTYLLRWTSKNSTSTTAWSNGQSHTSQGPRINLLFNTLASKLSWRDTLIPPLIHPPTHPYPYPHLHPHPHPHPHIHSHTHDLNSPTTCTLGPAQTGGHAAWACRRRWRRAFDKACGRAAPTSKGDRLGAVAD